MVAAWYPRGVTSAAERLRYYATWFDTVEVDSTFYGLPTPRTAALWAERTPPGFVFHVKAFAMMTRHPIRPEQLPPPMRQAFPLEVDRSGRVIHPPQELREAVFDVFVDALQPLRAMGKLGVILFQLPPYLDASARTRDYLRMAVDLLSPDRVAVEFRHASWVAPDELPRTTALLEELGAAYVCVDEPRIVSPTVLPPLALCTTPALGYVRLHGRNAATWNARAQSAAERFRYQYTVDELEEWVAPIVWLAKRATATYVLFNNCYGDYAPQNARQMMSLLDLLRE
jgi:uncharacterized protein YecE (DUF72 family)